MLYRYKSLLLYLHANIKGNFIYNCQNQFGLMTSNFGNAYVNFIGNSFHGGKIGLVTNTSYQVNMVNNNFVDIN